MKVTKIKKKEYDRDFDEEEEEPEEDEEGSSEETGIEDSGEQEENPSRHHARREQQKPATQLSKEEVGDLIEGHLIRASQLFQIYRGIK